MAKVTVIAQSIERNLQVFISENGKVYAFTSTPSDYMKRAKLIENTNNYDPMNDGNEPQKIWPSNDWEVLYCNNARVKQVKRAPPCQCRRCQYWKFKQLQSMGIFNHDY